jgi:pseudo-rSAM protein
MDAFYWFYIDTFIHISLKKNSVLFYNPFTGKILDYYNNDSVTKLIGRLLKPQNQRVIQIASKDLHVQEVDEFIQEIRQYYMGDIIEKNLSSSKPTQMTPIVKIQKDMKYLSLDKRRSPGENVKKYLDELTLYINNECRQNCPGCQQYYQQIPFCTSQAPGIKELKLAHLDLLFQELKGCRLSNININGGNIFTYRYLRELLALLDRIKIKKHFYIHYLNLLAHKDQLILFNNVDTRIKLLTQFPINDKELATAWNYSIGLGLNVEAVFLVSNIEEYRDCQKFVQRFSIEHHSFFPLFNDKNLDFFEDNIFITRESIETNKPTMHDIYVNSTLNSFHFGKISIFPDGWIGAGMNESHLGTLEKHTLADCILKEMQKGKSWFKTRRNVSPCKYCHFEALCPPISNYNKSIGRNDLCHLPPKY